MAAGLARLAPLAAGSQLAAVVQGALVLVAMARIPLPLGRED